MPDVLARWLERAGNEWDRPRTAQSFCVPKAEIEANGCDLSLNRYKQVVHAEVAHRAPVEIIAELRRLEGEMLELANISAVRDQLLLLERVAGDEWWQDVTLPMLEQARRRLRGLVKLLEVKHRRVIYTDFADELGESIDVELPVATSAGDFECFRLKARSFLRVHEDWLALHKLKRNQPLTAVDLEQLGLMLQEAGGTDGDLVFALERHRSLPAFVRSLVGLDRESAKAALSHLIAGSAATASQIRFINEIVGHLTENGAMPEDRLYQTPFIDIHAQGPDGVFAPAQVEQLFVALDALALRAG